DDPQHRILHDIEAERLIAPRGATRLPVQPVEVALMKQLDSIFITGRQRRRQFFGGARQGSQSFCFAGAGDLAAFDCASSAFICASIWARSASSACCLARNSRSASKIEDGGVAACHGEARLLFCPNRTA